MRAMGALACVRAVVYARLCVRVYVREKVILLGSFYEHKKTGPDIEHVIIARTDIRKRACKFVLCV